ncbi:MAG: MBL fold metallo-hydrolase [Aeromicrobium sp.]|nr:MBL fold metallo-hydrolase [Burkholderiales bacterium]
MKRYAKPLQSTFFGATGTLCASLFASALLSGAALAQQNFDKVEIKTQKLTDSIYMLVGSGGNIGLSVGPDAVFMIDDQYAPLTPKIEAAIKAITPKPVTFVINTHWHGDHTGGNVNMGKAGAIIVAHDNVRKRLSSDQFIEFMRVKVDPTPKEGLPIVTFSQTMNFHLNGDDIAAFHVPNAHTDGDSIIHFKRANIVHMGDTFFNGFYPFIDYSSGGTPDGFIAATDRVLAIADDQTKIIPGHGPLATKADLIVYRNMLAATIGKIKALAKQGKTLEEIVAAKPTADFDERWGKGFVPPARYIEMIIKGLPK